MLGEDVVNRRAQCSKITTSSLRDSIGMCLNYPWVFATRGIHGKPQSRASGAPSQRGGCTGVRSLGQ